MVKKILIIEDDISIAELQRDYLEIDGFEVDIALTGEEGLHKALHDQVDLILLDLMQRTLCPKLDGFKCSPACMRYPFNFSVVSLPISISPKNRNKRLY